MCVVSDVQCVVLLPCTFGLSGTGWCDLFSIASFVNCPSHAGVDCSCFASTHMYFAAAVLPASNRHVSEQQCLPTRDSKGWSCG